MNIKNTDIFGRKVFFIAPDSSLIPLSFMEDFCTLGYESHIVGRGDGSLTDNIDIIASHFPDSVLFVNVDATASAGGGWLPFIRQLRQQNPDMLVGVVFSAAQSDRINHVSAEFGNDVSPAAGCIALAPGENENNFKSLLSALEKVGAKGRRNNIRAQCDSSSYVSFSIGGKMFHARIDDVNISHLCCILDNGGVQDIKIYDKVRDAHICVNGLEFTSDIVLIMKRVKSGIPTVIFMFIKKPEDEPGLGEGLDVSLNKKIYEITSRQFTALLHR